jgi:ribosomal protein L14
MPKGSRVLGPTAKELKEKGFDKIAMMASELL